MQKNIIKSVIDKYYLNDSILPVWITVVGDEIVIPFVNDNETLKGYVKKSDIDISDMEFGIFNHKYFKNIIELFQETINVECENETLTFRDGKYTINCISADKNAMSYISDIPEIFEMDGVNFDVKFIFDKEFVGTFLKSTSIDSYELQDTFEIKNKSGDTYEFIVGKQSKIKFKVDGNTIGEVIPKIYANVKNFQDILSKNKDLVEGYLSIQKYLIKLEFENENGVKSTYFMPTESKKH